MSHSKLVIAASLLGASLLSTAATARDGFSVGSVISNGTFSHTIERNTGSNTTPSITSRTEETDYGFGLSAGYQGHITDDLFLGAEVFYQELDTQTRNLNNLLITELNLNQAYGLKVKLGVDVNDKFSLYGLLGQTTLDFDINNSYPFAPPVRSGNTDVDEVTIGIGAEYAINENWSFVAEFSQLNDVNFDPLPEVAVAGKINDNEVDYQSLSFGLNYNF